MKWWNSNLLQTVEHLSNQPRHPDNVTHQGITISQPHMSGDLSLEHLSHFEPLMSSWTSSYAHNSLILLGYPGYPFFWWGAILVGKTRLRPFLNNH